MSECRASKIARKNSSRYRLRQLTIDVNENDLNILNIRLKQYLKENHQ